MKIWETRRALFKVESYSQRSRVFVENFAAKLPTSPQLTVLEHQSSSSRSKNINLQANQPRQTSQSRFKTQFLEEN
jgi:hypothetical protein